MRCLRPIYIFACLLFAWLPAHAQNLDEAWHCLDLSGLRAREKPSPRPADLPAGSVEREGVPLCFAKADEAWRLVANGQRLSLAPVEGGRYYELSIAARIDGVEDQLVEWELIGSGDKTAKQSARWVPRGQQHYSLVIASPFVLQGLRLPRAPGVEVHAISVRWVASGPGEPSFTRAYLLQARQDAESLRYLQSLDAASLSAEAEHLRQLYAAQLAGDDNAVLERVRSRWEARTPVQPIVDKQDRIHLCWVLPPARAEDERALALLGLALERSSEIRAALGGIRGLAKLAQRDPSSFERLVRAAREGRLELAGWQWPLVWPVLPDASSWRAAWGRGLDWARENGLETRVQAALVGDPTLQPDFVETCLAHGRARALVWADDRAAAVLALRSATGKGVIGISIPNPRNELNLDDARLRIERAQAEWGVREALLPLALPANWEAMERIHASALEWNLDPAAPSVAWSTPIACFDAVRATGRAKLAPQSPRPALGFDAPSIAAYPLRAAVERLRVQSEVAWRWASLASLDGLHLLRGEHAALSEPAADLAGVEAQLVRAAQLSREALAVLARSVITESDGVPWIVFNGLAHERTGVIEVPPGPESVLLDAQGKPLPMARSADGTRLFQAQVPSIGHALYHLLPREGISEVPNFAAAVKRDGWSFQNSRFSITLDPELGELTSLRVLPENIELLGGASNRLLGFKEQPRVSITVREQNEIRTRIRILREDSLASVEQDLDLERDRPELVLQTRVKLHGKGAPPRLAFAWRDAAQEARIELAGAEAKIALEERQNAGWIPLRRYLGVAHGALGLGLIAAEQLRAQINEREVRLELSDKMEPSTLLLRPYLDPVGVVRLGLCAEELAAGLQAFAVPAHKGLRPPLQAYLSHGRLYPGGSYAAGERSGIRLESLRAVGSAWLEVEFAEQAGEAGELELELDRRIFGVERRDPATQEWKAMRYERGRIRVPIAPQARVGLRLKVRP